MKIEQTALQNARPLDLQNQRPVIRETAAAKKSGGDAGANSLSAAQMSKTERSALPVSEQVLINSIERANKAVLGANTRFEFSIHEQTKEILVKVLNADTGELLREIPSEKILDIVAGIWQAVGLFVDEKR